MNLLELTIPGGDRKLISGPKLLELFLSAGGYIPWLFFLSACHSGEIRRPSDWQDFLGLAQGKEPGAPPQPEEGGKDLPLGTEPGFTGTAHALLQGGVPSVVAMRYAVGDDYARELGVEFYRELLARTKPKNVATALTLARRALLDLEKPDLARYAASDHVTPVLYGAAEPGFELPQAAVPNAPRPGNWPRRFWRARLPSLQTGPDWNTGGAP